MTNSTVPAFSIYISAILNIIVSFIAIQIVYIDLFTK